MRSLVAEIIRQDRRKVIAIFTTTRAEAERAVRHVRAGGSGLPIRAWCVEPLRQGAEHLEDCERVVWGAKASRVPHELRALWSALSVVAWTGKQGGFALKLLPF